jgi:hypothetical protein
MIMALRTPATGKKQLQGTKRNTAQHKMEFMGILPQMKIACRPAGNQQIRPAMLCKKRKNPRQAFVVSNGAP